jgi:cytochrome c oxidase subunit 2
VSKERSNTASNVVFAATAITCILFALTIFSVVMPNRITWMMDRPQASSYAYHIDGLFGLITYLVGFWFVLSEIVLFYFIFKYRRKTPDQKAEYVSGEEPHQKQWISVPHILVILCDVVLVVATIFVWYKVKQTLPPTKPENVIKVIGQQWAWTFQYPGPDGKLDTEDDLYSVDELHLKVGEVYHFKLSSKDVLHCFSIPAFRIKQDSVPGRTITGWFEPVISGEQQVEGWLDSARTVADKKLKAAEKSGDTTAKGVARKALEAAGAGEIHKAVATGYVSKNFNVNDIDGDGILDGEELFEMAAYDIQCAEMCGIGHGLMKGILYVHSEGEYDKWLATVTKGSESQASESKKQGTPSVALSNASP